MLLFLFRWYRAQILGVKDDQYDIFYVDHGDREWLSKSKVHYAWPDILSVSCFYYYYSLSIAVRPLN